MNGFDLREFLSNRKNHNKIRYIGFSMAFTVMLIGIGTAIIAGVIANGILGVIAAGVIISGFVTLPITDVNFTKSGYYY